MIMNRSFLKIMGRESSPMEGGGEDWLFEGNVASLEIITAIIYDNLSGRNDIPSE